MKFTASEFLVFARSVQSRAWSTLHRGKAYRYTVETRGIQVTPSTGEARLITNWEIARFSEIYSESNSLVTKDYQSLFNKSYLLPLANAFEPTTAEFPLAEEIADTSDLHEGAVRIIAVNMYERSAEARRLCVETHGSNCVVCGFSFADFYGDLAVGFIHVHHLTPLALRGNEHKVDPATDLRPVCPNCHAVIHLRGACMSIEQLKSSLRKRD